LLPSLKRFLSEVRLSFVGTSLAGAQWWKLEGNREKKAQNFNDRYGIF
jgi:hypothetical protein